jgi:hypothetical protein
MISHFHKNNRGKGDILDLEGMVHTPELAPVSPSVCVKRFVSENDRGWSHPLGMLLAHATWV